MPRPGSATAAVRLPAEDDDVPPRPQATRRRGDITREHLLDTAQRLFAENGIDGVSLNEIVAVAGVRSAAIHYYFRSKDGLLKAVLQRGATSLGERRDQLLDELETKGDMTLRGLMAAMVLPIHELTETPGGFDYARVLAYVSLHPRYNDYLVGVTSPYTTRYLHMLEQLTPGLPRAARLRRFAYAQTFAYHAIASHSRAETRWTRLAG